MTVAAVVYVSSAASAVVRRLKQLAFAGAPGARLLSVFPDEPYARTSLLLAGEPTAVCATAVRIAEAALAELDLREHVATHPRIGIVDHISVAPVDSTMACAADAARAIGSALAPTVPIYFYGAAHVDGRTLAATRRVTPYFKASNGWTVAPDLPAGSGLPPSERTGACCCGAVPLVLNFNMLLATSDVTAARAVADAVRTRTGGPPGVEALALEHEGGRFEVACNLLTPEQTTPAAVRAIADSAAERLGTSVASEYTIGLTLAEIRDRLAEADAADAARAAR